MNATVLTMSNREGCDALLSSLSTRNRNLLATSEADDTIAPLVSGPRPERTRDRRRPRASERMRTSWVGSGSVADRVHGELLHDGAGARRRADPAPFIGVSLYTWTSIIGVCLAGISAGNFIGGVLADKAGIAEDAWPDPARRRPLQPDYPAARGDGPDQARPETEGPIGGGYAWLITRIVIVTAPVVPAADPDPGHGLADRHQAGADRPAPDGVHRCKIYAFSTVGSIVGTFLTGPLPGFTVRHPGDRAGRRHHPDRDGVHLRRSVRGALRLLRRQGARSGGRATART